MQRTTMKNETNNNFRTGAKFLIRLDELEVAQGVTIVGHRLEPFRDHRTPTEKLAFEDSKGKVLRQKLVIMNADRALQYFSLYGKLRMLPRIMIEDRSSMEAMPHHQYAYGDKDVHIFALDLKAIENGASLAAGDYLTVTMLDTTGTRFRIEPLPIAQFDTTLAEPWRNALIHAFKQLFATEDPTLDPIELMTRVYSLAEPLVVERPGGTYLEFSENNNILDTYLWQGIPVIWDNSTEPEQILKKLDADYLSITDTLSKQELSILQDLTNSYRESDEDFEDEFYHLAKQHELSVDSNDIELFLTAELTGHPGLTKITKKTLTSDAAFREIIIERAIDRVLVGLRLTGISETDVKVLRASALDTASNILTNINLSIIKNPTVNHAREQLMTIYERFLLWMRIIRGSLAFASEYQQEQLEQKLIKMNELLNVSYMLNEPKLPDDTLVQNLLKPGSTLLAEYLETLRDLEHLMSSRRKTRHIPENGRIPTHATLSKQGYAPSAYRYELEVILKGTKPHIYRTLLIPGNRTLADLHSCLQDAFNWEDYHLHEFRFDHMVFGEPSNENEYLVIGEDIVSLDELTLKVGNKIDYIYDLGDNWIHSIKVKSRKKLTGEEAWTSPCTCVAGARAAPPEDCGGIEGYKQMLAELEPSLFPTDKKKLPWNPENFDIEALNKMLAYR